MSLKACIYFVVFVFCQESLAQNHKNIHTEMLSLQESNFVHFNKSYFYNGERVWFNAYILYADLTLQDSLSKVLYADFISPSKQVLQQYVYKIEQGVAYGDFHLPDTLKSGNYFLRVYTNWMRNYGDSILEYYPIRILNKDKIPLPNAPTFRKCDYLISISDTIQTNTQVNWEFTIPNLKKYSIAITDTFLLKRLNENYHLKMVNTFPENKDFDLNYPLEKGLSVNCTFETKKKKKIKLSVFRKSNGELSTMETDEKGVFNYTWEGETPEDYLVLNVDSPTQTNLINTNKKTPAIYLPIIQPLVFELAKIPSFIKDTLVNDAIALKEVVVKAKRIEEKFASLTHLYGKPDNIVNGKDIQQAQVDNPLLALQGRVPGVRVFYLGGQLVVDIHGSSQSSFSGQLNNPLVLLDGVPFANESLNQVAAIPSYTIRRIEIVKTASAIMGSRASSGVINIITNQTGFQDNKPSNTEPSRIYTIPIKGFDVSHSFQHNEGQPYWQANAQPLADGTVQIHFKSGTKKTVYQIELIGILTNGNLIKCYKNVVVQ